MSSLITIRHPARKEHAMNPIQEYQLRETRRYFFGKCAAGLGGAALASTMRPQSLFADLAVIRGRLGHKVIARRTAATVLIKTEGVLQNLKRSHDYIPNAIGSKPAARGSHSR